jgi:hypothetical protein
MANQGHAHPCLPQLLQPSWPALPPLLLLPLLRLPLPSVFLLSVLPAQVPTGEHKTPWIEV